MKRIFDFIFALVGLIVLSPLFLFVGIILKIDSSGSVYYRGKRTGKNNVSFRIYKFRSMIENADILGGPSTARNDPRLTKTGKVLRKYKLDELPQLINILEGEMSFVGPRPQEPRALV